MTVLNLPAALAAPVLVSGKVVSRVMLDLTLYLAAPAEQELEYLIDLYHGICPPERLQKYKIAELEFWPPLSAPFLTQSGRAAAAAGSRRPYLEPVRRRIREGRALEIQYWDGRSIDDPAGSWSFNCRRIHLRSSGLHAFVRFLLPLTADPGILQTAALAIADNVALDSGHGGLAFVYDPWFKQDALDAIYAQARRFWGVDVEDLNATLPLMQNGIKGVNWITLAGNRLAAAADIREALPALARAPGALVAQCGHAVALIAGPQPVAGDQHRPDPGLDPYFAVAKALRPLILDAHPDFSGERFIKNGNTLGWIRRFIEPGGWR